MIRSLLRPLAPLIAGGLAALAVAALPGCNPAKTPTTSTDPNQKVRVAVVTNCTDPFWNIAEAGATKAGQEFNAEVVFRQPATAAVATQMEIVDDVIKTSGMSGVAVSVVNPTEQTGRLGAISKKLNLITMDNDAADSGRKCYIGVNNYEAGKAVGRLIQKALPAGGTVALFIGSTASANANDRIGGVVDQLAGAKGAPRAAGSALGKFTLADIYTDDTDQSKALTIAKDVIEKLKGKPDVCLVGLYAYNPKALVFAAREKGQVGKMKIAGFDENEETLRGVEQGEILGTVVQDPFNYGYKSVEILASLARGDSSKAKDFTIPHRLVTKDGGAAEEVGGFTVVNLKATDFAAKLKADADSVKK